MITGNLKFGVRGIQNIEYGLQGCTLQTTSNQSKFYGQAERAISTGKLHALLRLHIQPINVVVFHGPSESYAREISS